MTSTAAPAPRSPATQLKDCLFVQTASDDHIHGLADRKGSGLVLSGRNAIHQAMALREKGFERPILVDRRCYAGNSRTMGTAHLSTRWLMTQRAAGTAAVLTDSGYVGEGHMPALRSVLGQAAEAGEDVIAVLPLHRRWLREDVPLLIAELRHFGVPVALVLEDSGDPFAARAAVRGLVDVLRSDVPVGLLCTDLAGLGAIAFGAQWAAVGVRSSLRHLYPVSAGWHRPPAVSALVGPLLSLVTVERIARTWAATPENPLWTCTCTVCHSRTLDWLLTASEFEANRHTFELLLDLRDGITELPTGPLRQQSWRAKCEHAIYYHEELALADNHGWASPRHLKSWCAL